MPARRTVSLSSRRPRVGDIDWNNVIRRGAQIVTSFETSMTLRQLFYALVSEQLIPNHKNSYKTLSRKSAQARREGWFPSLIDRTREIERWSFWGSPHSAMNDAVSSYRRDRTEGQEYCVYIGVEKHGMVVQLMHWYGDLGIPILALGGYSSQTFVDDVRAHVMNDGRPSVMLYAGDFDASGVDIDRDFEERTDIFDEVIRVGLLRHHIDEYSLPPMPGKEDDARSASFILDHGDLIQVELDALNVNDLKKLYQDQLDRFWDAEAYEAVMDEEEPERERMALLRKLSTSNDSVGMATAIISDLEDNGDVIRVMDAAADRIHNDNAT